MEPPPPGLAALLDAMGAMGEPCVLLRGASVAHANSAYLTITGRTLDELRSLPNLFAIIAPEDLPRVVERYMKGGMDVPLREGFETTLVRADGSRVHVEMASMMMDPQEKLVLSIVRDVTVRKKAERSLRESEERFRRAFEDAAIGLAIYDAEGRYLRVNRSLCELLAYSEAELLTMTYSDVTHPEDLAATRALGDSIRAMPTQTVRFEKRYLRKDGGVVWALVNSSPLPGPDGKTREWVAQIVDITAGKLAQTESRRQLVARKLVRRLLRDLAEGGVTSASARRALGRGLADETKAADLAGYLDALRELGIGELRVEERSEGRYAFSGIDLLERAGETAGPTCHIALGYLESLVTALEGAPALGSEVRCQSQGHARCSFVVHARRG